MITLTAGLTLAATATATCGKFDLKTRTEVLEPCPAPILGPGGQAVEDSLSFVHQPLQGDGTITVRVTSMTGRIKQPPPPGTGAGPPPVPGLVPWAKAGLMIKDGINQGSPYAAIMVTAEHGVRMQHNFTEDTAGSSTNGYPRWLRLTRTGDTLTGSESGDGKQWTEVGKASLDGLPDTVQIGLFAASPGAITNGASGPESRFAEATATFDQLTPQTGPWKFDDIGVEMELDGVTPHHPGAFTRSGDTFTVTGVGDVAPSTNGQPIERMLIGGFAALLLIIAVATTFATTTRPHRYGTTLTAKATVIGTASFAAGLIPAAVVIPTCLAILPSKGVHPHPAAWPTYLQLIVGTGLLFAAVAILSVAIGTLLKRTIPAVTATTTLIFAPYLLALAGIGEWLLAVTPAAGFAIQQSVREYAQVEGLYSPATGYFPLPPWAGLAILCAYAALALWSATKLPRRQPPALSMVQ
ncbi:DUF1349 domain-containing protein [Nonomuraea soli]|uniref:DUF1349 domain-containing protein n=1 Tax=Nonomuraea soli TaxID=1032476 RepID=A0A7W0CRZ4_9ACTN|nr:DUF1349 domain-containing protein [Nonomuraea soli]MBA2896248.1 hypothetical protein [Nonomuraea soli]